MNMCLSISICMSARRIFDKFRFGKTHSMALEYNIVDYIDMYTTHVSITHMCIWALPRRRSDLTPNTMTK